MHPPAPDRLVPILQLSIGPVILISGVGLLLLTLTNPFGRLLDRTRQLKQELAAAPAAAKAAALRAQIGILLLAGVLLLFVGALFRLESGALIVAVFGGALIGAMLAFIRDMNLALAAVRLEVGE